MKAITSILGKQLFSDPVGKEKLNKIFENPKKKISIITVKGKKYSVTLLDF